MSDGRFAPTPSGDLHLGNLRTALLAWLFARSAGSRFVVRIDDVDGSTTRVGVAERQLADLARLGLEWDGPVVRQQDHGARYAAAVSHLEDAGLTYPCWCSRRDILEAVAAPHGPSPEGAYPGTCRDLSAAERSEREASDRPAALRLRAEGAVVSVVDRLRGRVEVEVDDFVLRRGLGLPAYNLTVVVDDAVQEVDEVVRGDDLLLSTPRQVHLARLLDLPVPSYAHVPLVLGPDGSRLAKRDGAVTLTDRERLGESADEVRSRLAASLGLAEPGERVAPDELIARFEPDRLPKDPWVFDPSSSTGPRS